MEFDETLSNERKMQQAMTKEMRPARNPSESFSLLQEKIDQALTHLLVLKHDRDRFESLYGILQAVRELKDLAESQGLSTLYGHASESELFLATIYAGKITVTDRIVDCLYKGIDTLRQATILHR